MKKLKSYERTVYKNYFLISKHGLNFIVYTIHGFCYLTIEPLYCPKHCPYLCELILPTYIFFVIYCPEILFVLNIISFWNYSPTLSLVANYYPILFFLIKIVISVVELFYHLILVVKYCVILSSLF